VKVPDQPSERDFILKKKDGLVRLLRKGLVNKFQEKTRPQKQGNQHNRHAPQPPPGEGPLKGFFGDASRAEMENQRVEEISIALPILSCPCCAWKNGTADSMKKAWPIRHFVLLRHKLLFEAPRYRLCIPCIAASVNDRERKNEKSGIPFPDLIGHKGENKTESETLWSITNCSILSRARAGRRPRVFLGFLLLKRVEKWDTVSTSIR